MILHFISDDKFADYAISQFSGREMQSEFVLISYSNLLRYVEQQTKFRVINPSSSDFRNLLESLGNYKAIVLHGIFDSWCEYVLRNVPENVKVAWMFWGGEIYGRRDVNGIFLARKTKILACLHYLFKKKEYLSYELPKELFCRIDYCLTDMQEEYEYVKHYANASMQHLWYNYYSIDETIGTLMDCRCEGENVFVGNSCTLTCNYVDVFGVLRKRLENRKIIVPLSYGQPWLRNILLKLGNVFWNQHFIPLVQFLPRNEYNNLMLGCSTMIQPHYRPQAQGNIITALWLGMRVYLSERNMAYHYFNRIGAVVFSLEHDFKRSKNPFASLSKEEMERNRKVLRSYYSKEIMYEKNLELVNTLSK